MKTTLFVLLGLVAVLALTIVVFKKLGPLQKDQTGPWPFYVKRPLTQPEQVLYHRLIAALPGYIVLAQVQASRVLGVKKGFNFHQWNNRIDRLSFDFVVCRKDATVVSVIELDDKSHEAASRVETDRKKEKATADAGIQLVRWHVKALPDITAIQAAFAEQQLNALPKDVS